MGRYREFKFMVNTPAGKTAFHCKAKTEAAARAAARRYEARMNEKREPVTERLAQR